MAFPADDLTVTNLDGTGDDPSQARTELLAAINKIKTIIAAYGAVSGFCELDASGLVPLSRIPGGGDADTVDLYHAAQLLARANHTGTQLLSTISDAGALAALDVVTGDKMQQYGAGDYVPHGAMQEMPAQQYYSSWTKVGEYYAGRAGTVRCLSDNHTSQASNWPVYVRLYKNGVYTGQEYTVNYGSSSTFNGWQAKTLTGVNVGDLIQLYVYCTSPNSVKTRFMVCSDGCIDIAPMRNANADLQSPPQTSSGT